jgi:hypothetical protein
MTSSSPAPANINQNPAQGRRGSGGRRRGCGGRGGRSCPAARGRRGRAARGRRRFRRVGHFDVVHDGAARKAVEAAHDHVRGRGFVTCGGKGNAVVDALGRGHEAWARVARRARVFVAHKDRDRGRVVAVVYREVVLDGDAIHLVRVDIGREKRAGRRDGRRV